MNDDDYRRMFANRTLYRLSGPARRRRPSRRWYRLSQPTRNKLILLFVLVVLTALFLFASLPLQVLP